MDNNEQKKSPYLPLWFALVLVVGIFIGREMGAGSKSRSFFSSMKKTSASKFNETLTFLEEQYVDTVNEKALVEEAITAMLHKLDPHSFYIPAEDLQGINESLEGNFEGIGVEFNIHEDTILVVTPVSGGPADQLGILAGDRIVKIEGKVVAGVKITNKSVMQQLRGAGGTKVSVSIMRGGNTRLLPFTITRGKIPIYSVDASYMVNDSVGYIKINRFAETTFDEYQQASQKLRGQGMKRLILDLRNNPGGYLTAATNILDDFLPDGKLLVYTEGRVRPRENYMATSKGDFEKGKLCVLVDEGSASASEIVSGAIQDWDRGTIIGRRSFGKGLVQDQTSLPDGSALRLTIARYYTPSGRCIQKPYDEGRDDYDKEIENRIKKGELENSDSISFADSLKFKTKVLGRTVYGGGGIMPDIFVPLDTTMNSYFLSDVLGSGNVVRFAYNYADRHRAQLLKYTDFNAFNAQFVLSDAIYAQFLAETQKEIKDIDTASAKKSETYLRTQLKALIARAIWKGDGFYIIINGADHAFGKALEVMNTKD